MNAAVWITIAALFTTSCLVRIVPALITLRLPPALQRGMERILPVAVFINFAVYIVHSEFGKAPLATAVSLLVVGGLALTNRLGLITATLIGSTLYFLVEHLTARV